MMFNPKVAFTVVLPAILGVHVVYAAEFFVAPDGSDSNLGTIERPFATLERAREGAQAIDAEAATIVAESRSMLDEI